MIWNKLHVLDNYLEYILDDNHTVNNLSLSKVLACTSRLKNISVFSSVPSFL